MRIHVTASLAGQLCAATALALATAAACAASTPGDGDSDDGAGGDTGGANSGSGGTAGTTAGGSLGFGGMLGTSGSGTSGAPAAGAGAGGASSGAGGASPQAGTMQGGSAGASAGSGGGGKSGGAGGASGGSGGKATGGSAGSSIGGTGGGILFFDDFESGAGRWTPDVDDGNDILGNWGIVNQNGTMAYKQQTSYADASWTVAGDLAWTDQRIDAKIMFPAGTSEDAMAMLSVRYRDRRNYYRFQISAGGEMRIYRTANGSSSQLGTYDLNVTLATGVWLNVAFSVKGSTFTGMFALPPATMPSPVAMGTDTSLASGKIGLGTNEGAMTSFDDVRVSTPP